MLNIIRSSQNNFSYKILIIQIKFDSLNMAYLFTSYLTILTNIKNFTIIQLNVNITIYLKFNLNLTVKKIKLS